MKTTPELHVPNKNKVRVGIYSDAGSSYIDTSPAVAAIDSMAKKFGNIVLAESRRLVELTDYHAVTPNTINWLEAPNHLNIVLTHKSILDDDDFTDTDSSTVGITLHRPLRPSFVIIDAYLSRYSMHRVVQHESAHVLGVKDSGTYHDHASHCNHPRCFMQPILHDHLRDFCDECNQQMDERLHKLSRTAVRNAGPLRRALRAMSGHDVPTVQPFDRQHSKQLYYYPSIA